MAPKHKSSRDDLKQEDVLQAVVLADSFNNRFLPITEKVPRVLLPLVNIPLIDYSLEFLAAAGIEEIFVFCSSHSKQIDDHLRESGWYNKPSCSLTTVILEGCYSLGDAMRDIDNRSLIRNDFVLIFGDTVANLQLTDIFEIHKKRRQENKLSVMTLVMKKADPGHPARSPDDDFVIAADRTTDRVLHFEKIDNNSISVPASIAIKNRLGIHYDLLDCQISICSAVVPQMFTDDFDYQTRDDLVKGILINEEITGNSVHLHIAEESYATRVTNLHMYNAVSKDILHRWCYPLVPDMLIPCRTKQGSVSYGRHNIYQCKDVTLERGCKLIRNVIVGRGTTIASGSVITDSVIGNKCQIGKNVQITGAYLWDNVTVGDNCHIDTSILCSGVQLLNNVVIKKGCILSWNVKIGDAKENVTIGPSVQLMFDPPDSGFDDDIDSSEEIKSDPAFGSEAQAFKYEEESEEESDEEAQKPARDIWGTKIPDLSKDDDSCSSVSSVEDDCLSDAEEPPPDDYKLFTSELWDTLLRAEEEHISSDNLILEINSLKHSYNISIKELNQAVLRLTVEMPLSTFPDADTSQLLTAVKTNLLKKIHLLKNYSRGTESQLECLEALEESSLREPKIARILTNILHLLYDKDTIEEAAIIKWFQRELTEDPVKQRNLRKTVEPLITWLEQAEEEEDDDDEDEEEEEEEEDDDGGGIDIEF